MKQEKESGANLVEYLLLVALVLLLSIGATRFFSTRASENFSEIGNAIDAAL